LAASGAWVGTTAACVICSIMTFLAARLPRGRGVGSTTTGAGAAGRLALDDLETGAAAGAALGTDGITGDTAALAAGWVVALEAVLTADLTAGLAALAGGGVLTGAVFLTAGAFLADALLPGGADFATGLAVAFTAGLAAALLLGGGLVLAVDLETDFRGALEVVLAAGLAALAAGLAGFFTAGLAFTAEVFFAAGARALAPDAAGLPDFAVLGAGAFTKGLLSVPDEAGSRAVRFCGPRPEERHGGRRMRRYTLIAERLWRPVDNRLSMRPAGQLGPRL
jgi:hypothetical protein